MTGVKPNVAYGYTPVWAEKDKYNVRASAAAKMPLRIGIVGLGGVALGKHLPALRRLQQTGEPIEVAAGADLDPVARGRCESLHGFPCYPSAEGMLDQRELDALLVLTDPGNGRLEVLRQGIERGLHMFVEKPLLFLGVEHLEETILRARDIVERARDKRLVLMTGFAKRFSPPYALAKQLVESGAIGAPSLVTVKMCQGWSRHILLEGQACHLLHVALWIAGPIAGLSAMGTNRFGEPNYPHDNVVANVRYSSGAIGTFAFNSSSPSLKPWERIEIFGERKWLVVEDGASVTLHDSEEGPSKVWAPVMPHTLFFDEEFGGFTGELSAFAEAIRSNCQAPVTGDDGIDALSLAWMIHTAIGEQRYVPWGAVPGAEASAPREAAL